MIYLKKYAYFFLILFFLASCEQFSEISFIQLKANFSPSKSLIQLGDTITFNQLSTLVAKNYEWDFGDSAASTEGSPRHIYQKTGLYTVRLISTKADGTSKDTLRRNIRVLPKTAQASTHKTFGEAMRDETGQAFQSLSNGFIMVGRRNLNTLYILRTDLNNTKLWEKEFDNITSGQIQVSDVQQTKDGGFVIAGNFQYNSTATDTDAFILKIDDINGDEVWRTILATSRDEKYNALIQLPGNNNFVVVGSVTNVNQQSSIPKILIDRYSPNGVLQESIETGNNWQAYDIKATIEGGFVLAAEENKKPMLLEYSASFELTKTVLPFNGRALGVIQLNDGDYALVGEKVSPSPSGTGDSTNAFVAKISFFGSTVWTSELVYYHESLFDLSETQTGEIIAVGTHDNPISNSDVLVAKYSKTGSLMEAKLIGGKKDDSSFQFSIRDKSTKFHIFGTTESFGAGLRDFYLIELNTALK